MLELFSSGLLSVWLERAGVRPKPDDVLELLAGPPIPGFVLAGSPDAATDATLKQYLQGLVSEGMAKDGQGVWVQTDHQLLASNQGTVRLPSASLTKVATSLAALLTWGPDHQFETLIGATGVIKDGVLQGDLAIASGGDPLFVWEEAIALGNTLNQLGIRRVTGNLVITGNFAMNFESDPKASGEQLIQALDSTKWQADEANEYLKFPKGTPKPQVAIAGSVLVATAAIPNQTLLVRHRSLPLAEILKQMNIYSNNDIAQMLADSLGGHQVVQERALKAAGVPKQEIHLINGSGLGQENQISPRAACAMFVALERFLQRYQMSIADLFPVSGRDLGTLEDRFIPTATVVKTGTLWDVSALAGVLPTRDKGWVWFAIINRGNYVIDFRDQQDKLLQRLAEQWGTSTVTPAAISRRPKPHPDLLRFGAAGRNEILSMANPQS